MIIKQKTKQDQVMDNINVKIPFKYKLRLAAEAKRQGKTMSKLKSAETMSTLEIKEGKTEMRFYIDSGNFTYSSGGRYA